MMPTVGFAPEDLDVRDHPSLSRRAGMMAGWHDRGVAIQCMRPTARLPRAATVP
jgi:hypothetical protein